MTYTFKPAAREKTSLLLAIAGASGSGKTFSALKLATGLAAGGNIAFIDTEAGRALHYADQFTFDHCDITAPFRPASYIDAIQSADKAGYAVIVIDSMSHEYDGEGGILDWATELELAGTKSPGNWKEPKQAHKRMVTRLLQCRAHLIFCLRAEEKMLVTAEPQFERDGVTPKMWNGKQSVKTVITAAADRPINERWQPLCEKRFMYEMTASLLMLPDHPGIPVPVKLQEQHRAAFPAGQHITEQAGITLATWAAGGKAPTVRATDPITEAEEAAEQGMDALQAWWAAATVVQKRIVKPRMEEFKQTASAADSLHDVDDDPFGLPATKTLKPHELPDYDPSPINDPESVHCEPTTGVIVPGGDLASPDDPLTQAKREAEAQGHDDGQNGRVSYPLQYETVAQQKAYRAGYAAGERAREGVAAE